MGTNRHVTIMFKKNLTLVCDCLCRDSLKSAASYFQRAAGVFESLKRDIDAHPQPSDDLRGDTLTAIQSLLLAQAQECFLLKATEG